MIRVAMVEDDPSVRDNLCRLIDGTPGYSCVAACASSEEALRTLPKADPDVVLMDIHLRGQSGIACITALLKRLPKALIIMLTVETSTDLVFESLKSGATGYLVKHSTPEQILEAIRSVHLGGAPMSAGIARMVVMAFRDPSPADGQEAQLSPRELEVLRALARGLRSKEIADQLSILPGTVNTHIRHIYEKLHVRSRAEAVYRLKAPKNFRPR